MKAHGLGGGGGAPHAEAIKTQVPDGAMQAFLVRGAEDD